MLKLTSKILFIALLSVVATNAVAKDNPAVKATKITDSIYYLTGKGGNLGVSIGADGTFLIDDQFAVMTDAILAQIKALGGDVPKFVINTHFHGDHSGGNQNLGEQGAIIVAHDNVRKRLSKDNFIEAFNMKSKAYPSVALPVITFSQEIKFHLNQNEINIVHVANAHTDGDSVVHFKNENVIHAGDTFFNGFYPFIDVPHGGTLLGAIEAVDTILSMSNKNTKIIPGHGPMASKADLESYRNMLKTAYKRLSKLKKKGKTVEQAIAAKPLKDLNAKWGNGIFKAEKWIGLIYKGLD